MSTGSLNSQSFATPPQPPEAVQAAAARGSYGQILRSSAMIGGSQVVTIAIGIVRTKAMAVLLGPAGVGLAGLYGSIADVAVSVAGMGVNSSGVRQIAESVGSGDTERIAITATVLRRTSVFLGLLGAALLIAFSMQVSALTFGSGDRAAAVSLLGLAVLLRLVSAGQGALVQGMRRISDLAKMGVLGALFGTLLTIPLVYFFKEDGIVPAFVAVAATTIITSWWYSRKIEIQRPSLTASQVRQETVPLLKLGLAFMASGLMVMGSAYAIRLIVLHNAGFEATGLYHSAWTLGGLYVGFILQAMGADFYPRLTAVANDNAACNRLVNEQARIGLLLAGPGAIATLTFAPVVIAVLYSGKFIAAVGVLRWICLGAALRVMTWPMGFIILAKGERKIFFWTELAWTTAQLGLGWLCVRSFGVDGAGMAFFGSYVFHGLLVYPIVRSLTGFKWSSENQNAGLVFAGLIAFVFCSCYAVSFAWAAALGALVTVLCGIYSIQRVLALMPSNWLPRSDA